MCLDTGSQASVHSFCDAWWKTGKKIDCLILNAGISNVPKREETEDGFERQFATNYLCHFTLTVLLLPYMNNAACIIPVASLSHKRTLFHFEDLQLKQCYNPMTAYSQSKLAVLTFALELSRRIANNGLVIKVIPVHPGVAATDITRGGDRANPVIRRVAKTMFGVIGQSAARVLGRLSMLQFPVMCKAECITAPMVLENAVEFLHRLKSHLKHQIEKMPQDCG